MKVISTKIPDVLIIEPKVFEDERGFLYESFNKKDFLDATGVDVVFVQDNHSRSNKGVLRGLHYQLNNSQGKLVRVVNGEVFDVAVDLRKSSPTYGDWVGINISAENKRQVWIPPGFAHGFLVLSECVDFLYKTTNYYSPKDECCIIWNDKDIQIDWPDSDDVIISDKDRSGNAFRNAKVFL